MILIACSGGADSTYLVHYLAQHHVGNTLKLIYFDHQLRPDEEIRAEKKHIHDLGKRYGMPVKIRRLPVKRYAEVNKVSLEMAGRYLRYSVLHHEAQLIGATKIALGHHLNDLAESFLLQLTRGAQFKWVGIEAESPFVPGITLIRPLLSMRKTDILAQCQTVNLAYCTDSTNAQLDIQRNRLRHIVIPELEQLNSRFLEHAQKSASYLAQVDHALMADIQPLLDQSTGTDAGQEKEIKIPLTYLNSLSELQKKRLIYELLRLPQKWIHHRRRHSHSKIWIPQSPIKSVHLDKVFDWIKNEESGTVQVGVGVFVGVKRGNLFLRFK